MKTAIRIISAFWLLALLPGCDQWPPQENELRDNFTNNRQAFDALATTMKGSDYVQVTMTAFQGTPRADNSRHVAAAVLVGEDNEKKKVRTTIKDDPEWHDHFVSANVFATAQRDGVVNVIIGGQLENNTRHTFGEYMYVYDADIRESLKTCLPEHEKLRCGLCVVALEDDWYVEYWWSPEELVPGGYDQVTDKKMTLEEYDNTFVQNLEKCRLDGNTAIGYQ